MVTHICIQVLSRLRQEGVQDQPGLYNATLSEEQNREMTRSHKNLYMITYSSGFPNCQNIETTPMCIHYKQNAG